MIRLLPLLLLTTFVYGQIDFQSNQSASFLVDQILHSSVNINGSPTSLCGAGYFTMDMIIGSLLIHYCTIYR